MWTRVDGTSAAGESRTAKKAQQIDVEQRWFIGSHADIGGGNDRDGAGRAPDPLTRSAAGLVAARKASAASVACSKILIPDTDADTGMPRNSYAEFMDGIYKARQATVQSYV